MLPHRLFILYLCMFTCSSAYFFTLLLNTNYDIRGIIPGNYGNEEPGGAKLTGEEIKTAAERYLSEEIDPADAIEGINQALVWLGTKACLWGEVQIQATAMVWYSLPDDCLDVRETDADWFEKIDNHIRFPVEGTYTVRYYKLPPEITVLSETPAVHQVFHRVLITGLAAWWKFRNDDSKAASALYAKFERDAQMAASFLRRRKGIGIKVER